VSGVRTALSCGEEQVDLQEAPDVLHFAFPFRFQLAPGSVDMA
jgi:hypothetical protein